MGAVTGAEMGAVMVVAATGVTARGMTAHRVHQGRTRRTQVSALDAPLESRYVCSMHNIFEVETVAQLSNRINALTPTTTPAWGKMTVDQMLAHCNVTYEMVYENTHPKPGPFKRFIINLFVRQAVLGPKPYKRNLPTAPQFKMVSAKDFAHEQQRLLGYLQRVLAEGASAFNGRESNSFGALTSAEWNVMFYKHLDHHLTQFGV